jgi:predicted transcriptional regulator of viral defense system
MQKIKKTQIGLEVLKDLASNGVRIFNTAEFRQAASATLSNPNYLLEMIHHLKTNGWIHQISKGLYHLDQIFLNGIPIHEFEIVMALNNQAAISHFSAMHYHNLTDQMPLEIFWSIPKSDDMQGYKHKLCYKGTQYHAIQTKKEHFFGIENIWIGDVKIRITDKEKTLLDGLSCPKYSGGLMEILYAFNTAELDIEKIIEYALKYNIAVAKRLGWTLDSLGKSDIVLDRLAQLPTKSYHKLDVSGKLHGKYNSKWHIVENI